MRICSRTAIFLVAVRFLFGQPVCRGPAELESQPAAPSALNALGAYFAKAKQFDCAIQAFTRASALDRQTGQSHFNLGLAYLDKGDAARAIDAFRESIAGNPKLHDARSALAALLTARGLYDEAEAQYQAVLDNAPANRAAVWSENRICLNFRGLPSFAGSR